MLDKLKAVNLERIDLDEAVELLTYGKSMQATYLEQKLEAPDWLKETVASLTKDIAGRRDDNLKRALKSLETKREAFKTRDQKLQETDAEIARIKAELGQ
jgi:hypothetical protein